MKLNEIRYTDLQLELESQTFKKIEKQIKELDERYRFSQKKQLRKNQLFHTLLSNAIYINEHYSIENIIKIIGTNLKIDVKINFFLYQSSQFSITCFPEKNEKNEELYIFVSQHFLNNLNEDEQVSIIGHELGHFLMGHLKVPLQDILDQSFDFEEIKYLKSELIKWSNFCELTADLVGLVANNFNYKAYSTAMIKHYTGLNDSSNSKFNISPLVDLFLKQYDKLANDPLYIGATSSHPLAMLRIKIIDSITRTKLIRNFGYEVPNSTLKKYKKSFSSILKEHIREIYPEMVPGDNYGSKLLFPLMLAVAFADGVIDNDEIKVIKENNPDANKIKQLENIVEKSMSIDEINKLINNLIYKGIKLTEKKNLTKKEIVPILRKLLVVASADNNITENELEVIFEYASNFEFTRQDIILILQTHKSINFY